MNSCITDQHREQYRSEGYFVLPGVIRDVDLALLRSTCADAVRELDAQMDRQGTQTLGINHKGKRYFCGQTYTSHPELGRFLFSALMADICQSTLGSTAFLHNDQFVVKCERAGMNFAWHQDGAYVHTRIGDHPECITCWCALDDVDEQNGTISILPLSESGPRTLVDHVRDPVTNDLTGYFGDSQGMTVTAPAGSIAVFSSVVFHRSGANPSGQQRRAYLAQYAPVAIQNAPGQWPQYLARPFLEKGCRVNQTGKS